MFFLVPSSAPLHTAARTLSSTEILVTWDPPNPIDQNGIIIDYKILYFRSTFTEIPDSYIATNSGNSTMILIGNLEEYVEYSFAVGALTSVGSGNFSDPISNTTFQDGN